MVTKEEFVNGILDYADAEIIPNLPTIGKWGIGALLIIASKKTEEIISQVASMPLAKTLGLVDCYGNIDVDSLGSALKESASKYGPLEFAIPMLGVLKFSASDIDKIVASIVGGKSNANRITERSQRAL